MSNVTRSTTNETWLRVTQDDESDTITDGASRCQRYQQYVKNAFNSIDPQTLSICCLGANVTGAMMQLSTLENKISYVYIVAYISSIAVAFSLEKLSRETTQEIKTLKNRVQDQQIEIDNLRKRS